MRLMWQMLEAYDINIINPSTTQTQLTAQWEGIMTRQQMLGVNKSRLASSEDLQKTEFTGAVQQGQSKAERRFLIILEQRMFMKRVPRI